MSAPAPPAAAAPAARPPLGAAEPWGRAAVLAAVALAALGVLMVYSSSAVVAHLRTGDGTYYLKRQCAWALLGLLAMAVAVRVPLDAWRRHSRLLLAVTVVLLAAVLVAGTRLKGATRWFRAGELSFQPSELAKLAVLLFTASWLCDARERLADFRRGFLPAAGAVGGVALLVLVEPDFGTSLFLAALGTALLIVGGIRMRHLLLASIPAVPVLVMHVASRLDEFRDRFSQLGGSGQAQYQVHQSLLALGSGGLLGRGLGAGTAKLQFLPESSSDFILPVVGEELGLAGTLLVVLLYAAFVRAGARVCLAALERGRRFAFLVSLGVTLWVGLQAAINVAVVTACVPTKGIALPFVSLGGSGLVVLFAATGLLYACARAADADPAGAAAAAPDPLPPAFPAPAGEGAAA